MSSCDFPHCFDVCDVGGLFGVANPSCWCTLCVMWRGPCVVHRGFDTANESAQSISKVEVTGGRVRINGGQGS